MSPLRSLLALLLGACVFSQIEVYHKTATVTKGTTRQFTAYVPLSPNTVVWSVNNVVGGNATIGTISSTGLYAAPVVIPAANLVTVRATSTANPNVAGAAAVTIAQPQPSVWSVSPSKPAAGSAVQLSLNGSSFVAGATVHVNGMAWPTTFVSSTSLKAQVSFAAAGTYALTVVQPNPGSRTSQAIQVTAVAGATPPPVTVTVTPTAPTVKLGATQQFSANVGVTWSATAGTINAAGLFQAPVTMPATPTVVITATSVADATKTAQVNVLLATDAAPPVAPPVAPGATLAAGRFLEQATFGPTPEAIADLQQKTTQAWLDEQFNLPETTIPLDASMSLVSARTLNRLATAPDQLRQRMAWALGQILVISANKNVYPDEYVPHLRLLSKHAFGNYRALLKEITLSPQMGKFLDLANSNKPGLGGGANENFPRELLQLFTVGLVKLNIDGTTDLTPTYTQADIRQFSLALTGWTYPTAAGAQPNGNNWENFSQPQMEPRPGNHDTSSKVLLNGQVLPAGQTVQQDLESVLDNVFLHPNTGPFIAVRLIRGLVMSNPSGAYISRVAQVFNNNGTGVRGDLKAVLRAILTDPEARNDTPDLQSGRLKDPIYLYVSLLRALGGNITASNQIAWTFSRMGQAVSAPPSVFGYYSPLYRVPSQPGLFGPEFQIYTPTESVLLGNEIYQVLTNPTGNPSVALAPFQAASADINQLLDLVNQRLFYGRMSAPLRAALMKAIQPSYDQNQRLITALYLAALSGQYAVQY